MDVGTVQTWLTSLFPRIVAQCVYSYRFQCECSMCHEQFIHFWSVLPGVASPTWISRSILILFRTTYRGFLCSLKCASSDVSVDGLAPSRMSRKPRCSSRVKQNYTKTNKGSAGFPQSWVLVLDLEKLLPNLPTSECCAELVRRSGRNQAPVWSRLTRVSLISLLDAGPGSSNA